MFWAMTEAEGEVGTRKTGLSPPPSATTEAEGEVGTRKTGLSPPPPSVF